MGLMRALLAPGQKGSRDSGTRLPLTHFEKARDRLLRPFESILEANGRRRNREPAP